MGISTLMMFKKEKDSTLQVYLVGGAVRDKLLGLPGHERDWVVVGSTPEEMLQKGYIPVGKEFPVFLHPETHEEYALARTERKVGKGYQGFVFYADPTVTLEEDLKRRDLTINAMAEVEAQIIDPYGGKEDLQKKLFRHVSEAFQEDPVRILRLARFSSKLPDFTVHPDTLKLMQVMVNNGEVDALVPERVWQELVRALGEKTPLRFFEVLEDCGALSKLFPWVHLNSVGMQTLTRSIEQYDAVKIRFSILCHDLSVNEIQQWNERYRLPNEFSELALLTAKLSPKFQDLFTQSPEFILDFMMAADPLRRPERFEELLDIFRMIYPDQKNQIDHLKRLTTAIQNIDTRALQEQGLQGKAFADELRRLRVQTITSNKQK